jgi:hypothetical protein
MIFYHFYFAPGMILNTVKSALFSLVHLIYVGNCYYKPKCLHSHTRFLYRHIMSSPSQFHITIMTDKDNHTFDNFYLAPGMIYYTCVYIH